jgi:hypothetical protein
VTITERLREFGAGEAIAAAILSISGLPRSVSFRTPPTVLNRGVTEMRAAIFLSVALSVTTAPSYAETYRCSMDRQITVGAFGPFKDDKEYNKGREFYLAINNSTQRGTYSTCTAEAGCSTVADVWGVQRWEGKGINEVTVRSITLITGANSSIGMLWNLQQWYTPDFTAIAVAAIEHERWSHWQRYVHSKAERQPDGSLRIPPDLVARWQRQIDTPFAALNEDEKQSDRDQVKKYLPLIIAALEAPKP